MNKAISTVVQLWYELLQFPPDATLLVDTSAGSTSFIPSLETGRFMAGLKVVSVDGKLLGYFEIDIWQSRYEWPAEPGTNLGIVTAGTRVNGDLEPFSVPFVICPECDQGVNWRLGSFGAEGKCKCGRWTVGASSTRLDTNE